MSAHSVRAHHIMHAHACITLKDAQLCMTACRQSCKRMPDSPLQTPIQSMHGPQPSHLTCIIHAWLLIRPMGSAEGMKRRGRATAWRTTRWTGRRAMGRTGAVHCGKEFRQSKVSTSVQAYPRDVEGAHSWLTIGAMEWRPLLQGR